MKPWLKNTFVIAGIILLILMVWYFRSILTYIVISAVLSLMGRPVTNFLTKPGFRNYKIPRAIASVMTLLVIYGIIYLFFKIFIPVIVSQAKELSSINYDQWWTQFEKPLQAVQKWLQEFKIDSGNQPVKSILIEKLNPITGMSFLSDFFSSLTGFLGNLFIAVFSITFITFFFLKDQRLFFESILMWVPGAPFKGAKRP